MPAGPSEDGTASRNEPAIALQPMIRPRSAPQRRSRPTDRPARSGCALRVDAPAWVRGQSPHAIERDRGCQPYARIASACPISCTSTETKTASTQRNISRGSLPLPLARTRRHEPKERMHPHRDAEQGEVQIERRGGGSANNATSGISNSSGRSRHARRCPTNCSHTPPGAARAMLRTRRVRCGFSSRLRRPSAASASRRPPPAANGCRGGQKCGCGTRLGPPSQGRKNVLAARPRGAAVRD